jgi:hypothetical protein
VETAVPEGVTVAGLKEHEAPAGSPPQPKATAAAKPFCGFTVKLTVPFAPELTVSDEDEAESVKVGGVRLMV